MNALCAINKLLPGKILEQMGLQYDGAVAVSPRTTSVYHASRHWSCGRARLYITAGPQIVRVSRPARRCLFWSGSGFCRQPIGFSGHRFESTTSRPGSDRRVARWNGTGHKPSTLESEKPYQAILRTWFYDNDGATVMQLVVGRRVSWVRRKPLFCLTSLRPRFWGVETGHFRCV